MKTIFGKIGGICMVYLAGAACGRAADPGPYLKLELGPTLVEDATLRDFVGVTSGNKVEFDPGFRFSVGGGFAFNDFVAIGGETGFSYNSFDRISGGFFREGDSGVGNVPLMGTIVLKFPNQSRLVPFVGAGAGVSFTYFSADALVFDPTPGGATGDETIVDGDSDADTVFAWQLFGGLKYALNDRMSLGLTYKYMRTEGADWEAEEDFFTGTSSDIRLSPLKTHSVMFIFSYRF
jgi:opacity protein-like surface antigen